MIRQMRYCEKALDARREVQRMVVPFASLATPQMMFFRSNPKGRTALDAWRRCGTLQGNQHCCGATPCPAPKAVRRTSASLENRL
jgi:hypothetical protein